MREVCQEVYGASPYERELLAAGFKKVRTTSATAATLRWPLLLEDLKRASTLSG